MEEDKRMGPLDIIRHMRAVIEHEACEMEGAGLIALIHCKNGAHGVSFQSVESIKNTFNLTSSHKWGKARDQLLATGLVHRLGRKDPAQGKKAFFVTTLPGEALVDRLDFALGLMEAMNNPGSSQWEGIKISVRWWRDHLKSASEQAEPEKTTGENSLPEYTRGEDRTYVLPNRTEIENVEEREASGGGQADVDADATLNASQPATEDEILEDYHDEDTPIDVVVEATLKRWARSYQDEGKKTRLTQAEITRFTNFYAQMRQAGHGRGRITAWWDHKLYSALGDGEGSGADSFRGAVSWACRVDYFEQWAATVEANLPKEPENKPIVYANISALWGLDA